ALALDRDLHHLVHALGDERRPALLVAELRRVGHASAMADGAGALVDLLALGEVGAAGRIGLRGLLGRRRVGGGLVLGLLLGLRGGCGRGRRGGLSGRGRGRGIGLGGLVGGLALAAGRGGGLLEAAAARV